MAENKIMGMLSLGAPIRKGPQGPQGPIGPTGPVGPRGERGEIGPAGPQGERGIEGMPGPQGPRGLQGPQGERGLQGAQGPQGIEGPPGPQGNQGVPGATGPQGIQGAKGEKGDRGDGLRVKGTVNSESDIQEPKKAGDIYFVESKNQLVVWTGEKWVNLGTIRGPQGEKGPKGDQGPTGAQGLQGERGPQGERGQQGPIGPTGPQGNKGESGKDGVLIEDSKISNVNTWSSKNIIDHFLEGYTWKNYENTSTITDAANGYIRGLEIEGQTLKNEINYNNFVDSRFYKYKNNGIIEVVGNDWRPWADVKPCTRELKSNTEYTIIILNYTSRLIITGRQDDGAELLRIITSEQKKKKFRTTSNKGLKLKANGDNGTIQFMLLEGDYTQKEVPDFIEGVQGVGKRVDRGYKITIKTRNEESTKTSTSELIISQQLNTGDKLKWSNTKKKYVIESKGQEIDTTITNELFIPTYKSKTYFSQDSGVPAILKGQYPQDIKIHTAEEIKELARGVLVEQAQELGLLPQFGTLEETEHIEEEIMTTEEVPTDEPTTTEEV